MSRKGIISGYHGTLSDLESRFSLDKELDILLIEKTYRNWMDSKKEWTGIILRIEQNRDFTSLYGSSSKLVDESPVFYRAWLRVPEIHGNLLP